MTNEQERAVMIAVKALLAGKETSYRSEILEGPSEVIRPGAYALLIPVEEGDELMLWFTVVLYEDSDLIMPSSLELRNKILNYRLRSEVRAEQAELEQDFNDEERASDSFCLLATEASKQNLPVIMIVFGLVDSGQFKGRLVAHLIHSSEMPFSYGLRKLQEMILEFFAPNI